MAGRDHVSPRTRDDSRSRGRRMDHGHLGLALGVLRESAGGGTRQGQAVFDYMETITRAAHLNGRFEWTGDEILVCDAQERSKADFHFVLLSNLFHWEARA